MVTRAGMATTSCSACESRSAAARQDSGAVAYDQYFRWTCEHINVNTAKTERFARVTRGYQARLFIDSLNAVGPVGSGSDGLYTPTP